jgi:hypothetical protein
MSLSSLRKVLFALGAFIVVLALAEGAFWFKTHAPTVIGNEFIYREGNFSLTVPMGWHAVDPESLSLPEDFEGLRFAFTQDSTACVIGYVDMPMAAFEKYEQTTPGERVFPDENTQIDSWWWVHPNKVWPLPKAQFEGRLPYPGEVLVSHYALGPYRAYGPDDPLRALVLFRGQGNTVPQSCTTDFVTFLKSLKPHYEKIVLTNASAGDLLLSSDPYYHVLFKPDTEKVFYEVYEGDIAGYENAPTLHNGLIYYATDAVHRFNIFTTIDDIVPGTRTPQDTLVLDFYLTDDKVFYLAGTERLCGWCNTKLYVSHLDTGEQELLLDGPEGGAISGFDSETGHIYLSAGYGDAGCFSEAVTTYSTKEKKVVSVRDFGACSDEPWYAESVRELRAMHEASFGSLPYLRVVNGEIQKPSDEKYLNGIPFRVQK